MSGMTGICPACGARFCGWALANPVFQQCDSCGCALEIFKDGICVVAPVRRAAVPANKMQEKVIKAR